MASTIEIMQWTVSAKGVLIDGDRVLLGLNDRHEWELPGGQIDEGETLREAVVRDLAEETSLTVTADEVLLAEVFEVIPGKKVIVIAFRCSMHNLRNTQIALSDEHHKMVWIPVGEFGGLPIPEIYRRAVAAAM